MTCEDCRYHNKDVKHNCNLYPAILPIEGVEICASFKPKLNDSKQVDESWESVSK